MQATRGEVIDRHGVEHSIQSGRPTGRWVDSGSRIPRLSGASITCIIQIVSISTLTQVKVTR